MNRFVHADANACIGCRACEVACVTSHQGGYPVRREDFVPRLNVVREAGLRVPVLCHHCDDAPCVASCPAKALSQDGSGVHLNADLCIGCKNCVLSCPFGAISMAPLPDEDARKGRTQVQKCDLCEDRGELGPACVSACPTGALSLADPEAIAETRMARMVAAAENRGYPTAKQGGALLSSKGKRQDRSKRGAEERKQDFHEIYSQFNATEALAATERCLHCSDQAFCSWSCPLHNHIPEWIKLVREGRLLDAAELSHYTNSLPEVCGRICPQDRLCESGCTLGGDLARELGAVTVGALETYITDTAFAAGWRPDMSLVVKTGKKVAVIGAGPAGLGCADRLARAGIEAHVYDRHPEIGGLLTFGIPSFKLDKSVLARRREVFTDMGITFHLNCQVGRDVRFEQLAEEYDAIFLGVGTYTSVSAGVDHEDAPGVLQALPYLAANTRKVMGLDEDPEEPFISLAGKKVVVLGGGDTAMDCLRTALRQGAESAICAYRRDEANMPGSHKEVVNAREEGAVFTFNAQPKSIHTGPDGRVKGIELVHTEMGEPGSDGRRRARPVPGSEFVLEADAIVLAFGFKAHGMPWLAELGISCDKHGLIITGTDEKLPHRTNNPRVFAGGDVIRGADLVVTAIADGRKAAHEIAESLGVARPRVTVIAAE